MNPPARERFALKSFDVLYHVGTFDPKDKGCRGESFEGPGLSVSSHPEAWRQIAKLGGAPVWRLRRPEGRLLDALSLKRRQRALIQDWALSQGLVRSGSIWAVRWFDEDSNGDVEMHFESEEDARRELDEGRSLHERPRRLIALPALAQYVQRSAPLILVEDFITLAYAELVLDLDGVYWSETLTPWNLSAPRGVLFPSKVALWSRELVEPKR